MSREFFAKILEMYMFADGNMSKEFANEMAYYLNQTARDFGYKDWVEAYHYI